MNNRPRPWPWLVAACAYFLAATFGHDWISTLYTAVFKVFGRTAMESSLAVIFMVLLAGAALPALAVRIRKGGPDKKAVFSLVLTAVFMFLANAWLICTNVENVHFPQYAVLALLLRQVLRDDFAVLCLCTLGGVFDEFMQYVMYPRYTKYLDFNDFILNLLGAAAGLALGRLFFNGGKGVEQGVRRVLAVAAAALAAMAALGLTLGRIVACAPSDAPESAFMRMQGKTAFVLSFVPSTGTFSLTDFGRSYYILQPLQGTLALAALLVLYYFLLREEKTGGSPF